LKIADTILEIEGRLFDRVSNLQDIDLDSRNSVEMVVLRQGKEVRLTVPVTKCYPTTCTLVVQFFGSILHSTHAAALEQVPNVSGHARSNTSTTGSSPSSNLIPFHAPGVYVSGVSYGSPALDILYPTQWILEVDGESVESVQGLLKLVEEKRWEQDTYVKVKQVNRQGITGFGSVKVDDRFWPCLSWEKRGDRWLQRRHSGFQFDN
jgi:S1-C subfamily serine protease